MSTPIRTSTEAVAAALEKRKDLVGVFFYRGRLVAYYDVTEPDGAMAERQVDCTEAVRDGALALPNVEALWDMVFTDTKDRVG